MEVPDGDAARTIEFLDEIAELQKELSLEYRKVTSELVAAQSKAAEQVFQSPDDLSDEQFSDRGSLCARD